MSKVPPYPVRVGELWVFEEDEILARPVPVLREFREDGSWLDTEVPFRELLTARRSESGYRTGRVTQGQFLDGVHVMWRLSVRDFLGSVDKALHVWVKESAMTVRIPDVAVDLDDD